MLISKELLLTLKDSLVNATGCRIQHNGWPCGSCFYAISSKLNQQDWCSILAVRGDYKIKDFSDLPFYNKFSDNIEKSVKKIIKIIS